jgi:hypothetical protein
MRLVQAEAQVNFFRLLRLGFDGPAPPGLAKNKGSARKCMVKVHRRSIKIHLENIDAI